MLTKEFLADAAFMGAKYLIETAAICLILTYCLLRKSGQAFRLLGKGVWLIVLSAALQLTTHYLLNAYFPAFSFIWRYVAWNLLTAWVFWRLYLRKSPCLTATLLTHIVVTDSFCQLLATYIIYDWKPELLVVTEFQIVEQLVSTAIIWGLFAAVCCLTLRFTKELGELDPRETYWVNVFGWIFFISGRLLTRFFLQSQSHPAISALVYFLFLIELCLFFVIAMLMVREKKRATEEARLNQQYSLQLQYADELNQLYQDLQSVRHETRNRLLYMEHLLAEERYAEMRTYFAEQLGETEPATRVVDCGNQLVNAILWAKRQSAERLNVPMTIEAALPEKLQIKGYHLCSVLVNLLDNAIEASKTVAAPHIHVILRMQQNYLFCCVSNRIDTDVLRTNPELHTTKKELPGHGFGIRSVKMIAELYHGMTDFAVETGEFVATVMLLCE